MKKDREINKQDGSDEQLPTPMTGRYDFPTDHITDGMTAERVVTRCGELQMGFDEVCWLCRDIANPKILMSDLKDPNSEAYRWYNFGFAQGALKLNIDLEANVSEPKAKDAYKHLNAERRRQAINKKLHELFGIE